ncbi:AAA family ATPase, partial [Campylobacter jejuni]
HDFGGWVEQKYLSKNLKFYHSKGLGEEVKLLDNLYKLKNHKA